jgi:hypothetical protein
VQGIASAGQALAVFLTGTVGLIGLFFTWQNTSQARKSTEETLDLTRRGQITERFRQAIDQLGATEGEKKNLEIRLGGIYALERTARDDRDYHWPIMEVLTSYVRRHAAREPEKDPKAAYPEPDIQAILTVIGRRSVYHRDIEYGPIEYGPIDLHATDLVSANLRNADLGGAKLREANLSEAILEETNLLRADLRGANLVGADLQEANLHGANLQEANLRGAGLEAADLSRANLYNANLLRADLLRASLREANLREANLQDAEVADHQLANTLSLQGATMPDGSVHP